MKICSIFSFDAIVMITHIGFRNKFLVISLCGLIDLIIRMAGYETAGRRGEGREGSQGQGSQSHAENVTAEFCFTRFLQRSGTAARYRLFSLCIILVCNLILANVLLGMQQAKARQEAARQEAAAAAAAAATWGGGGGKSSRMSLAEIQVGVWRLWLQPGHM